jgi:xeroderma pigmentosum group C-complementing protein
MSTKGKTSTYDFLTDSEDEIDWEEVAIPQAQQIELEEDQAGPSTKPNIEVILEAYPTSRKGDTQYAVLLFLTDERLKSCYRKKFSGGISHAERLLRIDCHKVHTVALISNAAVRNRWINDELLQVRETPILSP